MKSAAWVIALVAATASVAAQGSVYQQYAPVDLSGTWVSVVTEDWHYRMIAPAKGDFANLPLNAAAVKAASAWDPARVEPAGTACQAYAAPTIMREPGRVRISWANGGNALRVETDAGEQTRTFQFGDVAAPTAPASWQGFSRATWEYPNGFDVATVGSQPPPDGRGRGGRGGGGRGGGRGGRDGGAGPGPAGGALKVVTTNLRAGYLRRNGVPFSEDTVVTEYFNVYADIDGTTWMVVTAIVHDPTYLRADYITSSNFKKEPNDARWSPRPCTVR